MAITLKQTIYDAFSKLELEVTPVIAYNNKSHVIAVATSKETLRNAINNKETRGVIGTMTPKGQLGADFKTGQAVCNEPLTSLPTSVEEFILKSVIHEIKGSSGDVGSVFQLDIQNQRVSNNRFVDNMYKLLVKKRYAELQIKTMSNPKLPDYHVLIAQVGALVVSMTEHQISFMTSCGLTVVHGAGRDLYLNEIDDLLYDSFCLNKGEFGNLLMKAMS
ncbi:hypothetical protein [Bacillus toyonensis]|uniref:hypothetical protein n=1 Tax=Bacillus toyonensis TaxID=155322 RepID=UPI000BF30AD0|nr:hypothetical protein [Bacillus toyonensis]PGF05150.1 hypothetical protein COM61_01630 [Bacillus toyonensis]